MWRKSQLLADYRAMLTSSCEERLVDLNVSPLTEEDLAWADYLFLSAMIAQRDSAQEIIHRCKTAGVKIVAGGPLFTVERAHYRPLFPMTVTLAIYCFHFRQVIELHVV